MFSIHPQRPQLIVFLRALRERLITVFEQIEPKMRFHRTKWDYHQEGGGEIALLRGQVFEKAAINWSAVGGINYPLTDHQSSSFFATGVSLITHMANPHAPTAHFNIRFMETENKCWFGGGYDLSPMGFCYAEDTHHFHHIARTTLDPFGENLYNAFSKNAKEYFHIPHRHKERGVGGIFFDHFYTGNFEQDLTMWCAVGNSFIDAILPIYQQRINQPYTLEEREQQLLCRAHYAEFNLLYDRGTRFGFQSGGNPDAILCSMPPIVKW